MLGSGRRQREASSPTGGVGGWRGMNRGRTGKLERKRDMGQRMDRTEYWSDHLTIVACVVLRSAMFPLSFSLPLAPRHPANPPAKTDTRRWRPLPVYLSRRASRTLAVFETPVLGWNGCASVTNAEAGRWKCKIHTLRKIINNIQSKVGVMLRGYVESLSTFPSFNYGIYKRLNLHKIHSPLIACRILK